MADVIYTSQTIQIENQFVDGDTRTITLKNPKTDIQQSQITELNAFIQANNILLGDKTSATFGRILKVKRITKQERVLDIT